jgi:uncharacterized RDD family membrane protein YckC
MAARNASAQARIFAYLVDSVVLLSFILLFVVIGFLPLLLTSDFAERDAPDSATYAAPAIVLGGTMIAWSFFNMALLRWRGQTTGQYVAGIKVRRQDGSSPSGRRLLLRWLLLDPLLFHPLLAVIWFVDVVVVISLTMSEAALVAGLFFVFVCLIAPLVALAAVLTDKERRALHDRLAGTVVVRAE